MWTKNTQVNFEKQTFSLIWCLVTWFHGYVGANAKNNLMWPGNQVRTKALKLLLSYTGKYLALFIIYWKETIWGTCQKLIWKTLMDYDFGIPRNRKPQNRGQTRLGQAWKGHSYPLWKMVRNSHLGIEEVRQILIMIKQARKQSWLPKHELLRTSCMKQ